MKFSNRGFSRKWIAVVAGACGLLFTVSFSHAGNSSPLPNDNQIAMHLGESHGGKFERHHLHHGMGRGGKGICPQSRATAEAPDDILGMVNPLKPTHVNISEGENLFHYKASPTACKVCHGANGNGLGMMAASDGSPMPRNFTCQATMSSIKDGQMFWIIKNGSPGTNMPPHKLFLTDDEIWKLILYIRKFSE